MKGRWVWDDMVWTDSSGGSGGASRNSRSGMSLARRLTCASLSLSRQDLPLVLES